MWRAELVASLFLLVVVTCLIYSFGAKELTISLSRPEIYLIILPMVALVVWSAASTIWAPSWKSALHHTLVWAEYLIFYFIVHQLINSGKSYRKIAAMLVISLVIVSIPAIFEYCAFLMFGGGSSMGIRYARYGEQVNTLAPLFIVGILRLNGRNFVIALSAITAMWLMIFGSFGRTNVLLFAAGVTLVTLLVFFLRRFHKYRRKMATVVAVLVFAPIPLHLFALLSDDPNIPIARRITNEADSGSSSAFRKLMASISVKMFIENPLTGIGADNFGQQVNIYREDYSKANPDDKNLTASESEIPERSHNEFLQILAELGIVGGLISLWFLCGLGMMLLNAFRRRISLTAAASLVGVFIFLASSLITSYSFRLIQNGFVFFFVLAITAKFLSKDPSGEPIRISSIQSKLAGAFSLTVCALLILYCGIRVASVSYMTKGNYVHNVKEAMPYYETAAWLDDENPNPHFNLGLRLMYERRFGEAVPYLANSIEIGRATSTSFSYLSTAQTLSGDLAGAEHTFATAAILYPYSTFVLTRYAFLHQENGKEEESAIWLNRALLTNKKTAVTWWTLMNDGTQKASDNAFRDENRSLVMDLVPNEAIYALIAEREFKYPEEKRKLPL
ncbi:MAG: O-antigen ligase family protein [Pyrinomonadaceae bacterium]